MIITYLGKQFFKIGQGDLTVAFNPVSKESKLSSKISKFGSDIALSTTNHEDYNGFEMVSHGDTAPFEIYGAGSYEVKNIIVNGFQSNVVLSGQKFVNTIYNLTIDNISICFLGTLSPDKLGPDILEKIDTPDILFLPIGGSDLIDPVEAYKLATSIEPKIIIPMDYDEKSLKLFLKEAGQENVKSVEKLTLKAKDLLGREGEVVVLSS
jgi:L-ascorbate metabolism protein UlaG (beta-lactamase superfamily)